MRALTILTSKVCQRNLLKVTRTFSGASSSLSSCRYESGPNRSDAEILINKVPPIEVSGDFAVCDGGSGVLGHPVQYINLINMGGKPSTCKYCGLRFVKKEGSHGHHH